MSQGVIEIMKKVSFKLTKNETEAIRLGLIMYLNLAQSGHGLAWRAQLFRGYQIYESKFRKTIFNNKKCFKFNLNMSEAETLLIMLTRLTQHAGIYELTVINKIIQEIDQQTV
jgi:hypothetical protein